LIGVQVRTGRFPMDSFNRETGDTSALVKVSVIFHLFKLFIPGYDTTYEIASFRLTIAFVASCCFWPRNLIPRTRRSQGVPGTGFRTPRQRPKTAKKWDGIRSPAT